MRKLQQIYAMYTENQDALKDFLGVAWGEADTSKLTIQTQELQKRLLGMKQLSTMPTFSALERELQGCLKSLGLIKELHSDAMRKRHWEQIAKITGMLYLPSPWVSNLVCQSRPHGSTMYCHAALHMRLSRAELKAHGRALRHADPDSQVCLATSCLLLQSEGRFCA